MSSLTSRIQSALDGSTAPRESTYRRWTKSGHTIRTRQVRQIPPAPAAKLDMPKVLTAVRALNL